MCDPVGKLVSGESIDSFWSIGKDAVIQNGWMKRGFIVVICCWILIAVVLVEIGSK